MGCKEDIELTFKKSSAKLEVKDSTYQGCIFQDTQESFLFILRLLSDSIKNNLQAPKHGLIYVTMIAQTCCK